MGRDKALVEVDGVAMARRVAAALSDAGSARVNTIGGNEGQLKALGASTIADLYPGEGPLGGVITALRGATHSIVVIAACDMPWLEPTHVHRLIEALVGAADVDVAVSVGDGVVQALFAAWRIGALDTVQAMFDCGERAPRRAIAAMRHTTVELGSGRWSTDIDTPDALNGWS